MSRAAACAAAVGVITILLLLGTPRAARGQQSARTVVEPSFRLDAFAGRRAAVQAGVAVDIAPPGDVALEIVGGAGAGWGAGGGGGSARVDVLARYLLDPAAALRWSPYLAGGIGARWGAVSGWRGVLIALVGVDAPAWRGMMGGFRPFVEAGFGGGARVGIGFRRSLGGRR